MLPLGQLSAPSDKQRGRVELDVDVTKNDFYDKHNQMTITAVLYVAYVVRKCVLNPNDSFSKEMLRPSLK